MSAAASNSSDARINAIVPAAIMAVVLMMILPIPPLLLDLLISCNITLSVVTVIATMYIERPVELSVYPSLLLLLTLLRLSLNISSTRLILMNGQEGAGARRERRLDAGRVEVQRARLDVDEDGRCAGVEDRVGRRHEGERGNQHFVVALNSGKQHTDV